MVNDWPPPFAARQMPIPTSTSTSTTAHATNNTDARRTVIAIVSAALISVAVLALLAIFDVK